MQKAPIHSDWKESIELEEIKTPQIRKAYEKLLKGNSVDEARALFHEALDATPEDDFALFGLAISCRGLQLYDESISHFISIFTKQKPALNIENHLIFTAFRITQTETLGCLPKYFRHLNNEILDDNRAIKNGLTGFYHIALSLFFLEKDDKPEALDHLLCGLGSLRETASPFCDPSFYLLNQRLSQSVVGQSSIITLRAYVALLRQEAHDFLNEFCTASLEMSPWLLHLVALLRMKDVERAIRYRGEEILLLDDSTVIKLIGAAPDFCSRNLFHSRKNPENLSLFKQIVHLVYEASSQADVKQRISLQQSLSPGAKQLDQQEGALLLQHIAEAQYCYFAVGNAFISNKFTQALAEIHQLVYDTEDPFACDILSADWVNAFGHIMLLELHLQAQKLGHGPTVPRTFIANRDTVSNPAVIDILIENGFSLSEYTNDASSTPALCQLNYVKTAQSDPMHGHDFYKLIQANLQNTPTSNCLKIPLEWKQKCNLRLLSAGIRDTDKVAVFHCRQQSFKSCLHHIFFTVRNAQPMSFRPAIEFLINQGIHVIRIGDNRMSALEGLQSDYFHEFMDLPPDETFLAYALLDRANYYLGTNSGPAAVANMFGAKCLFTNWFPLNVHIANLSNNTMILPKQVRVGNETLGLSDLLREPFSTADAIDALPLTGTVEIVDNTPEQILAAAQDLISTWNESYTKHPLQQKAREVWRQYTPYNILFPLSFLDEKKRDFLK